jgi:hypothetical protein
MIEAIPEAINHWQAFLVFDEHLRADLEDQVRQWEIEYNAWVQQLKGSSCIFDTSEPCELCGI